MWFFQYYFFLNQSFIPSSTSKTHGITISDIKVEVVKPPMTARAIGARNEALSPNPKVSGSKAKIVVSVVIKIGRIRCCPAC
jgi:hypothetical protein